MPQAPQLKAFWEVLDLDALDDLGGLVGLGDLNVGHQEGLGSLVAEEPETAVLEADVLVVADLQEYKNDK